MGAMPGPISGIFRRADRVAASAGSTARLQVEQRGREINASLIELGISDALLSAAEVPELGAKVSITLTIPGRYIEFALPGMVSWHRDGQFGVSFDYLSSRQTYGLVLSMDLMRNAANAAAHALARVAQR